MTGVTSYWLSCPKLVSFGGGAHAFDSSEFFLRTVLTSQSLEIELNGFSHFHWSCRLLPLFHNLTQRHVRSFCPPPPQVVLPLCFHRIPRCLLSADRSPVPPHGNRRVWCDDKEHCATKDPSFSLSVAHRSFLRRLSGQRGNKFHASASITSFPLPRKGVGRSWTGHFHPPVDTRRTSVSPNFRSIFLGAFTTPCPHTLFFSTHKAHTIFFVTRTAHLETRRCCGLRQSFRSASRPSSSRTPRASAMPSRPGRPTRRPPRCWCASPSPTLKFKSRIWSESNIFKDTQKAF